MLAFIGYLVLCYVIRYRKDVVFKNLKNSFPDKSREEQNKIAQKFYFHFCLTFLESLKLFSASEQKFKRIYEIKNPEILEEINSEGKSAIIYGAHFGNWEWLSVLPIYTSIPFYSFYHELSNGFVDGLMLRMRQRFGNQCIASKKGLKLLIANARAQQQGIYYLIGDQSPHSGSAYEWFSFLNQDTAFLMGAPKMAEKFDLVNVYPKLKLKSIGHYSVELIRFPDNQSPTEMAQFYVQQLETSIKEFPHLWLWSHRRWKLKKDINQ